MSIIKINNLNFAYNKENVLENINLQIDQKDFLAIIGPNGGGKSTLLKLLLGLLDFNQGSIKIYDNEPSKNLSYIGYVPQNTNINTNFPIKVLEVVLMGHVPTQEEKKNSKSFLSKILNVGYNDIEKSCALNALKQVGMEKFINKKIGDLSGGQRQRVMIARALCANPSILVLDEPTASIDVDGQKQIYDLLKLLNKTITVIVVSHDISVIMGYANKVAHINKKLNYHNLEKIEKINTDSKDGHFCEVEMLNMLGKCKC